MKRGVLLRKTPMKRGRSALKRTALLRTKPKNRKRRATIPPYVRNAVKRRSGGRCVACAYRDASPLALTRRAGRIEHLHHVLPVGIFPAYELEADNLVGCCVDCHMNHEAAAHRIPWEALPNCALAFAARGGQEWAYLVRTYPKMGLSPRRGDPHGG